MSDTPQIKKPLSMSTSVRGKTIRKKNLTMPRINLDAANAVAGTPANTTCTTDSPSSSDLEAVRPASASLAALPPYMEHLPRPQVPEPPLKRRRQPGSPEGDSAQTACLLIAQSYALGYLSAEKAAFDREVTRLAQLRDLLLATPPASAAAPSRSASRAANRAKSTPAPECPADSVLQSLVADFADKIYAEMDLAQSPSLDVALLLELVSEAQIPVPSASLGNFFRSVYEEFGAGTTGTYSLASNQRVPGRPMSPVYEKPYDAASDAPAMPVCDGLNGQDSEGSGSDGGSEDSDGDSGSDDSDGDSVGEDSDDDDSDDDDSDNDNDDSDGEGDDDGDGDSDVVNTDFDFFDLKSDDFLSIKNLVRSLLESDHLAFDLSKLTDFIIEHATGITVKSEGSEGDPLGLLAVVDLTPDADADADAAIPKQLQKWLIDRTEEASPAFSRELRRSCSAKSDDKVALILHERLLNLPFDLLPYFYQLTLAELAEKGLKFTKFVVLSRVYSLEPISDERPAKKSRKAVQFDYFHAEDPELQELADVHCVFPYQSKAVDPESRGTQENEGLFPSGHALLLSETAAGQVPAKLSAWVSEINEAFAAAQ